MKKNDSVFVVENFKKLRKNEILNPKFVYT